MSHVLRFHHCRQANTAVEYVILLGLLAAICLVAVGALGRQTQDYFQQNAESLPVVR
ncbi:MAG: Flp family type IVb pilin [bacterium]|nr:Flp family type IVb pilin [bacterium]